MTLPFCAGRTTDDGEAEGSIDAAITILNGDETAITGNVNNNTEWDFAYFAVVRDGYVWVYNGLPAGETRRLAYDELIAKPLNAYKFEFFMFHADMIQFDVEKENLDTVYALCVGVREAGSRHGNKKGETTIIGVVEDWNKAVDDNCSETSYACFYMFR